MCLGDFHETDKVKLATMFFKKPENAILGAFT